jgi:hypothetical protein
MENKMEKVEKVYRDAINIFGRKLREDEKEILIKKMKNKTSFKLKQYKRAIIYTTVGLAVATAIFDPRTLGIIVPSMFLFFPAFFSGGAHLRLIGKIILPENPTDGTIFHECLHFLQDKGVIRCANRELIPTAAGLLYSSIKEIDFIDYILNKPILKTILRLSGHYEGYKLAKEVFGIKRKYGEQASWDYLYNLSLNGY